MIDTRIKTCIESKVTLPDAIHVVGLALVHECSAERTDRVTQWSKPPARMENEMGV